MLQPLYLRVMKSYNYWSYWHNSDRCIYKANIIVMIGIFFRIKYKCSKYNFYTILLIIVVNKVYKDGCVFTSLSALQYCGALPPYLQRPTASNAAPPATPHHIQNPKCPPFGNKMADQLALNKSTPSMIEAENGKWTPGGRQDVKRW